MLKKNDTIQFILIILMLIGLFSSRALLSVTSVGVLLFFLNGKKDKKTLQITVTASLLLIAPVVSSFFFSTDKQQWWRVVAEKMPLLSLGLGFSYLDISLKRYKQLSWFLSAFVFIGTIYTSTYYVTHFHQVNEAYLQASVLPTLLDSNHIHFSWLVVLTILLILKIQSHASDSERKVSLALIIWFIFFLHLLAAKTGLILLYLVFFILLISFFKRNPKKIISFLVIAFFIIAAALTFIPTFQNRIKFIRWDLENYSTGNFLPGLSDGNRWLSIKAGYFVFQQHPLTGTGFGDIKKDTDQFIQSTQPQIPVEERFLPLNQWIIYAAGSGIIGILFFTAGIILFLLLLIKTKNIFSNLTALVLIGPLFIDDTLETQFGIFIFIFFIFWMRYSFISGHKDKQLNDGK